MAPPSEVVAQAAPQKSVVYVDPAGVARFGRVLNNILPSASLLRSTLQQP